ncbi:MAG: YCF48-related protein [Bacteroidales bacterium]|jgi:photosystem II stability/assembly factor-like uncharacterized protein|nr:YCF48-related protein [Bacteroidales bacterium]
MKILSKVICLFLVVSAFVAIAQEVNLQNPYPTSETLREVYFFKNKVEGIAIGDGGVLLRSNNGGVHWERIVINNTLSFYDLSFISDSVGFVVHNSGVCKTTDRGVNWESLNFDSTLLYGLGLMSICFIDESTGWVAGGYKYIFKTNDGGETWEEQLSGENSSDIPNLIISIEFKDANHGFCGGNFGKWLKTNDGGENWTVCHVSDNLVRGIEFNNLGVMFIDEAMQNSYRWFHRSLDNGFTWESFRLNISDVSTRACGISVVDDWKIWVVGSYGGNARIYYSDDFGENWNVQFTDTIYYDFQSCYFVDSLSGWAVGDEGVVYSTNNGGNSWVSLTNDYKHVDFFRSTYFVDSLCGYVVGRGEYRVLKTLDGGVTWENIDAQLPYIDIYDVFFLDCEKGWMCGDDDWVYKTIDGGQTWNRFDLNIPISQFTSLFFINENIGWMCGTSSSIYKTIDGGEHWVKQEIESIDEYFSDVLFLNENIGWLSSIDKRLYKTEDGGLSWNCVLDDVSNLKFINQNCGWYYNMDNDQLYHTENGGESWNTLDYTGIVPGFDFFNEYKGIGVSGDQIHITTDGGETWSEIEMEQPLEAGMWDVDFSSENHAWVCGFNSCIYHINLEGSTPIIQDVISPNMIIYPNPTSGYLYIPEFWKFDRVDIFTVNGKLVDSFLEIQSKMYVGNYEKGIYLLNFHSEKESITIKLIKK